MRALSGLIGLCLIAVSGALISNRMRGAFGMFSGRSSSDGNGNQLHSSSSADEAFPMKEAIEKTFKVGKSIQWGVLQADVDPANIPSEEEQKKRIAVASTELINIDADERGRRRTAGLAGAFVASIVYGATIYFHTPFLYRAAAIYLPVAFSAGFLQSAQSGL